MGTAHYLGTELWSQIQKLETRPGFLFHALPWIVLVGAGIALVVISKYLHRTRFGFSFSRVAAILTLLCIQFFGAGLHHVLPSASWMIIMAFAVLAFTLGITHSLRHEGEIFVSLNDPIPASEYCKERPLDALIIFVSKPELPPTESVDHKWRLEGEINGSVIHTIEFTGKIKSDIDLLDQIGGGLFWKWQQLLRALEPHTNHGVATVRDIVLIGTEKEYLILAKAFLGHYAHGCNIEVMTTVPFEDFNQLMDRLRETIDGLSRHREQRIAVDITGGFKIASIAGAVLTLNRACVIQYVQTDKQVGELKALIYDLRHPKSSTPET